MKIKFSWMWILFLPFVIATHFYKVLFFLFLLMSIHESFHIMAALYLGYKIESVCIYPFGLSAQIECFEYRNSRDEIWITLCGLSVHIIAAFFLPFLCDIWSVSKVFSLYLIKTNLAILIFNLFPIYPLDGGRLLRNILEYFFSFKMAKLISLLSTFILIPIFLYAFPFTQIQRIVFAIFLMSQTILYLYQFNSDVHLFYLYRYLYPIKRKIKIHDRHDLYKNKENYIFEKGKIVTEKEFLKKFID